MMKVAVYGLGYVGSVTAACLADRGLEVHGVDVNVDKVDAMNAGHPPVIEPGLAELVQQGVASGRLRVHLGAEPSLCDVDVHIVCVGTPSLPNGALDTSQVEAVTEDLALLVAASASRPVVVFRSTMLPGTVDDLLIPLLERTTGGRAGDDFGVAMCPEFLRETTAVADFFEPPFTVAGATDDTSERRLRAMFDFLNAPFHGTTIRTAETIKYACNAFHAVKVSFANEIGRLARASGADAQEAMEIFCTDHQLNISPAYLRPGFAFGGSCLPKDVRALVHHGRHLDLDLPLLGSVLASNEQHLRHAIDLVMEHEPTSVCLLGLAFKTGTDDLRESPYVHLAETLLGKGIDVRIWDPDLRPDRLIGQNRHFAAGHLPHLTRLLRPTAAEALAGADSCVLGTTHADGLAALALAQPDNLIDLTGGGRALALSGSYEGVAW